MTKLNSIFLNEKKLNEIVREAKDRTPFILKALEDYERVRIPLTFSPVLENNTRHSRRFAIIEDACHTLITAYPNCSFGNLYHNFPKLETRFFHKKFALGYYDFNPPKITGLKSSLEHETLHMASSFYDGNHGIRLSGFMFEDLTSSSHITIGRRFCEAYTTYLEKKHFYSIYKSFSYKTELSYYYKFMEVLPCDDISDFYFNSNLYLFLEYCENLGIPKKDMVLFLLLLDELHRFFPERILHQLDDSIEKMRVYQKKRIL